MKQLILQGFDVKMINLRCKITHMCDASKNEEKKMTNSNRQPQDKGKGIIIVEEKIDIRGSLVPIHIRTLDEFTTFMILANCNQIAYAHKQFFKRKLMKQLCGFLGSKTILR